MFVDRPTYPVFYVPWGDGQISRHVLLGAKWLAEQPGPKAVFTPGKRNYENNATLVKYTRGAAVLTPRTVSTIRTSWHGGPLLACWPTEQMFKALSDGWLASAVTTVCVLEWGDDRYQRDWIRARGGVDVTTGKPDQQGTHTLPPVVQVAMEDLTRMVNHANGLVGYFDKRLAISTLQHLVRAGHRYDVGDLCGWALANGFTAGEVERLRDYAGKALSGHRFRLDGSAPLRADIVDVWKEEARKRGLM